MQKAAHVLCTLTGDADSDQQPAGYLEGAVRLNQDVRIGWEAKKVLPATFWDHHLRVWRSWWQQDNGYDCGVFTVFGFTYLLGDLVEGKYPIASFFDGTLKIPRVPDGFGENGRQHIWIVIGQREGWNCNLDPANAYEDEDCMITGSTGL